MTGDGLRGRLIEAMPREWTTYGIRQRVADALLPTIAAEVEARVQAAANQRAAEELEAEAAYDDAAPEEQYARGLFARRLRVRAKNLRAALASPAPTPHAEERTP